MTSSDENYVKSVEDSEYLLERSHGSTRNKHWICYAAAPARETHVVSALEY